MEVLYSSESVSRKIKEVLGQPRKGDRRVALVAFVGRHAESFLPHPDGLEIICWLRPGATDAVALTNLEERGARLFKARRLHAKVYWSSRRGCVITSANASASALARGGLTEVGVWLPPGAVDIQQMIDKAGPKPIRRKDLLLLAKAPRPAFSPERELEGNAPRGFSFSRWMEDREKYPETVKWKIGWWNDKTAEASAISKRMAKMMFAVPEPHDVLYVKEGQVDEREWLLTFRHPAVTNLAWMWVDFPVTVPPTDETYDPDYPVQAVQVLPPSLLSQPPFLLDRAFKAAFRKVIARPEYQEWIDRDDTLEVPSKLLEDLIEEIG